MGPVNPRNVDDGSQPYHGELTPSQIWSILRAHKKIVLGFPIAAGIAAFVVVLLLRDQWEAIGVIQVGQVGSTAAHFAAPAELVEPIGRAAERITLRSFDARVLGSLGIPAETASAKLYSKSKRVKPLAGDLIEMRIRGYSPDEAIGLMDATAFVLGKIHQSIAEPSIAVLTRRLELSRADLERSTAMGQKLQDALGRSRGVDASDRVILLNSLQQVTKETRELQEVVSHLEEQLSQRYTYPTSLLSAVDVSERPVSPKRPLIVTLATIVALLLGCAVALIANATKRLP